MRINEWQNGLPSHAVIAFAHDQYDAFSIAAGADGLVRLLGTRRQKIGANWGVSESASSIFVGQNRTVWVGTVRRASYPTEGFREVYPCGLNEV
jgi:hypothetical protein